MQETMKNKYPWVSYLLGLFLMILLPGAGQGQLPMPTGPFGIGLTTFDWTDTTRLETQSGNAGQHRELLVYLFYPIDKNASGARCAYFPHLKEIEAFEERFGKNFFQESYGGSYKIISRLKSHAIENAQPAAGNQRFPILILSHGGGIPVLFYTAIIENLVSHGYVVAAVEHSFDGATIVLPDGRIVTQSGWDQDSTRTKKEQAAFHAERHRTGSLDNRFVLSQLERLHSGELTGAPQQLRGRLDPHRVGALGHSLGGMISTVTVRDDARFRIGLNLDGGLDPGSTYGSLSRPVVAMFGDNRKPQQPGESTESFTKRRASRDRFVQTLKAPYAGATEDSYLLLVDSPAFSHFSYYDFPNAQAEAPPWRATPEQWERNQRIILDSTLAVMNRHLGSSASGPIENLLKQYPEVKMLSIKGLDGGGASRARLP
jgi:pimeloyl-ACP methyl ester carboxylesterase